MAGQHIAILTKLAAGPVYPALGLCSELVGRGYRVTFPTNERFSTRARNAGATAIFYKPAEAPREISEVESLIKDCAFDDPRYWHAKISMYPLMWFTSAAAEVAQLERYYASDPPNLILYDEYVFSGRILAGRLGCKSARAYSHFAHRGGSLVRIDGTYANPESWLACGTLLDSFMSTYGCNRSGHLSYVEQLNISYVPKQFQFDSDLFDNRFKFVGATHNRKPRAGTWKNRSADGKPVLLISENTGSGDDSFLKLCIEAFGGSQYHVVFSKVLDSPDALAICPPENFEINRGTLNCEILPFANVMLCQGGMGTTLESLYHGVPVVAVPSNPFNAEVAYRLAELGVGLHLPQRGTTPNVLREAVDLAASDAALRSRVKRFQSDLENGSSVKEAADSIEEYISS